MGGSELALARDRGRTYANQVDHSANLSVGGLVCGPCFASVARFPSVYLVGWGYIVCDVGLLVVGETWAAVVVMDNELLDRSEIFVFGSNLAGRHGKGAALYAVKHCGAVYGRGVGMQGRSYAIPTKDERLRPLDLRRIAGYVDEFLTYARANPNLTFKLTAIGCGLAGYKPEQIAPMFHLAPVNVHKPQEFML